MAGVLKKSKQKNVVSQTWWKETSAGYKDPGKLMAALKAYDTAQDLLLSQPDQNRYTAARAALKQVHVAAKANLDDLKANTDDSKLLVEFRNAVKERDRSLQADFAKADANVTKLVDAAKVLIANQVSESKRKLGENKKKFQEALKAKDVKSARSALQIAQTHVLHCFKFVKDQFTSALDVEAKRYNVAPDLVSRKLFTKELAQLDKLAQKDLKSLKKWQDALDKLITKVGDKFEDTTTNTDGNYQAGLKICTDFWKKQVNTVVKLVPYAMVVASNSKKLPKAAKSSKIDPNQLIDRMEKWAKELNQYLKESADAGAEIRSTGSTGSDLCKQYGITAVDKGKNIVPLFEKWTATNQKLLRAKREFSLQAGEALDSLVAQGKEVNRAAAVKKSLQ